jgi:hypothetical protein
MREDDRARWTKLVADFESADLSQREFAQERGLVRHVGGHRGPTGCQSSLVPQLFGCGADVFTARQLAASSLACTRDGRSRRY